MTRIKYLIMAITALVLASCMGDSYSETNEQAPSPYGNNNIAESNVVSIAKLKEKFANVISTDYRNGISYKEVTEDIKIKGVVTSSDIEGNIYNEIAIQDATGAIIISVAQSGIYGYLPIGTEILLDLKGLYIGNYGLQAQIGLPSTNAKGLTSIGRISRAIWEKHYKILSTGNAVVPEVFAIGNTPTTWNFDKDAGKLGIIRNVSFKSNNASVDSTFANANGGAGSVSWTLNEQNGRQVIVYNSNFADFANAKIPKGKVNITGIFKRFNNTWEIIIRTLSDIQPAEDNSHSGLAGVGEGTQSSPFNVTRAISIIQAGKADSKEYYIEGIISEISEVSMQYGNATYSISVDGKKENQLKVFRGFYIDGEKFTAADQIKVGQKVLILGKLKDYNGSPQIDRGSKLISIK